jgi:serine O-acetyltransferase
MYNRQELWAIAIFRFGKGAKKQQNALLRKSMMAVYYILNKPIEFITGVMITLQSEIGPGLYLAHWGGIYIGGKIGGDCTISQQVVIGHIGGGRGGGRPVIGDEVYIGSGAKILGEVTIGNFARIGANAVVVRDVPDYGSAIVPPCRIFVMPTTTRHQQQDSEFEK